MKQENQNYFKERSDNSILLLQIPNILNAADSTITANPCWGFIPHNYKYDKKNHSGESPDLKTNSFCFTKVYAHASYVLAEVLSHPLS
jgi:hypothetical protein